MYTIEYLHSSKFTESEYVLLNCGTWITMEIQCKQQPQRSTWIRIDYTNWDCVDEMILHCSYSHIIIYKHLCNLSWINLPTSNSEHCCICMRMQNKLQLQWKKWYHAFSWCAKLFDILAQSRNGAQFLSAL